MLQLLNKEMSLKSTRKDSNW